MLRATFSAMLVHADEPRADAPPRIHSFLTIIDLDEGMSVTNDIENVLSTLREAGELKPGMRVIYRDTEGVFDEVVIDARCEFRGFRWLGMRDRDAAIVKAISMGHMQ